MTNEERDATVAKMIADPESTKEEIRAEWKKEHPEGTDADFENHWGAVTATFGI